MNLVCVVLLSCVGGGSGLGRERMLGLIKFCVCRKVLIWGVYCGWFVVE